MSKKLIVCLVVLAVAGFAQAADVMIGTWESLTNEGWYDFPTAAGHGYSPDPDAWVDDPGLQSLGTYAFADDWYTDGYTSLKMSIAPASGDNQWGNKVVISVKNDYFSHSALDMDVYATGGWAQIICVNGNSQTYDTAPNPGGFYTIVGGWDPVAMNVAVGVLGQSLHVDYSAFKTSQYASPTDTYINLVFQVQGGEGSYLYFDNVRLTGVPEPATMGLLGLGGLALLRRKK